MAGLGVFSGAWPVWDLDAARIGLAVVRACWLAGLLAAAGALLFRAMEPALPAAVSGRILRLILASLAFAGVAWLAWVALQAVVLVGPDHGGWAHPATLVSAVRQTAFGRAAVVQLALLAAAALTLRLGRWLPALLALAATAAQVAHLHAWAMASSVAIAAGLLHLLGAAGWLGGLLPLRIAVRHSPPALAAAAMRRFSRRAQWYVGLLAASALVQGWDLLGGLPGIVGTAYGWVAIAKLLLFAALLGFAIRHRWRLTPALARPEPGSVQRALVRSLGRQTFVGVLVIAAAALLGALPPGMHVQPVWPFALRPSLTGVQADAAVARAVLLAGAATLLALVLFGLAIASRILRWPALAAGTAILWFAVPHLSPLLARAYPTSFARSPTGFAATDIAEGAALYDAQCARCHAALAQTNAPDGDLFWWLSHGIPAANGHPAMPGFAGTLDEDARWQIIDVLRARAAGLTHAATSAWSPPMLAPDLDADCTGGRSLTLRDLRGKPVRLVFQAAAGPSPAPLPGGAAVTVFVPRPDATEAAGGDCIAADPSVFAAYALVTGLPADQLAGAEVLIDAAGRLTAVQRHTLQQGDIR